MPVARNLSLPSAIEARKFKKRPDELHELKHSRSMPNKDNVTNSNFTFTDSMSQPAEETNGASMHFLSASSSQDRSGAAENTETRSPAARGTLSQPCLSESASVSATSIFPHLFLGSQKDVADEAMMKEHCITNVLNVSCNCAKPPHVDERRFRRIAVRDNYQEKITPHLDEAVSFIESARKKNERVLVHCLAGVSRSATVAIAYVMYYMGLGFDDAYRFVKEKRPTISPNFNFLGQLMEFEAHLRQIGRTSKPQAIVVDQSHVQSPRPAIVPKIEVAAPKPVAVLDPAATLIKPARLAPSIPMSSFCRRRKGPALEKLSFGANGSHSSGPHTTDCSGYLRERSFHPTSTTQGGAGVILDLHVSGPTNDHHSGRLGSDGRDDENDDDNVSPRRDFSHKFVLPVTTPYNHDARKTHSLPRYLPGLSATESRLFKTSTPASASCRSDPLAADDKLLACHLRKSRSATAPNTPAIMRLGKTSEREMSMDVDMPGADDRASPPSPQTSRFRSHTDPKDATNLFLSAPAFEKDRATPGSPHSDSFVSRKTRSPMVLKKSFNLSVRPMYGYQAFLSSKQFNLTTAQQNAATFTRSRTQDPSGSHLVRSRSDNCVMAMHCESPSADGLSSLTLSSPVTNKDDPLLVVGKNCLQVKSQLAQDRLAKQSGLSSATNNATTRGASSAANPNSGKVCTNGTSEPFRLVSSTELKPRWRNRHRSPKKDEASSDSAVSGLANPSSNASMPPASPTVLNHCNSVEMISCS